MHAVDVVSCASRSLEAFLIPKYTPWVPGSNIAARQGLNLNCWTLSMVRYTPDRCPSAVRCKFLGFGEWLEGFIGFEGDYVYRNQIDARGLGVVA